MKQLYSLLFLLFIGNLTAQVGIGTISPRAALEISDTNSGFLIPRIALSGNNDITTVVNPQGLALVEGTMIYNTNAVSGANAIEKGFVFWNGSVWTPLSVAGVGGSGWALTGNTINNTTFLGTTNSESLKVRVNNNLFSEYKTNESFNIGRNSATTAARAMAIGYESSATNNEAAAYGRSTLASGARSTALGYEATATADDALAAGRNADAKNARSVAIGFNAIASGDDATSLGRDAKAQNARSIALGSNALTSADDATAVGDNATASGARSTAIGDDSRATADDATAIGNSSRSLGHVP